MKKYNVSINDRKFIVNAQDELEAISLREELEAREEKMSRVPRHEMTEERMEELSAVIRKLYKGSRANY